MTNPRDSNGWKIPTVGTIARKVYDLHKAGKTTPEIARELGRTNNYVSVTLYFIRNPEAKTEQTMKYFDRYPEKINKKRYTSDPVIVKIARACRVSMAEAREMSVETKRREDERG